MRGGSPAPATDVAQSNGRRGRRPSLSMLPVAASGQIPDAATSVYGRGSVQGGSGFSPRRAALLSPPEAPPTRVGSPHPFAPCSVWHVRMQEHSHTVNGLVAESGQIQDPAMALPWAVATMGHRGTAITERGYSKRGKTQPPLPPPSNRTSLGVLVPWWFLLPLIANRRSACPCSAAGGAPHKTNRRGESPRRLILCSFRKDQQPRRRASPASASTPRSAAGSGITGVTLA